MQSQDLKLALKDKLTKKQLFLVPSAYDTIGDIAILEIKPEIEKKEKIIAETLLKLHKNLKVITKKVKKHSGIYRLRKLKVIAGEKRKHTLYKENEIKVKLDVEKCYFSPRLSTERLRVANKVKKGESILVMFSGTAVYPLVIAKHSKPKEIVGIEINPIAHKYAEENVKSNKFRNIKLYKGDVKEILPKIKKKFDRVLMPYPMHGKSFLDLAIEKTKKNGILHFYIFLNERDIPKAGKAEIEKYTKKYKLLKIQKCGKFSPYKYRVRFDFKIL
ncbi:MAG: methyltransferase domain-containing protein [Nanoarchaeota archaeon]